MSNTQVDLNAADLDPNLVRLGVLAGLLKPNGDPTTLSLDVDWFSNPLESIKEIPAQRGAEIIGLLETLLGSAAGNALGAPKNTLTGNWYPIKNPIPDETGDNQPTGLYLVTSGPGAGSSPADESDDESIVIGLGLMYPFTHQDLRLTVYASLPVLQLPSQQGSYFVFGEQPVELGFEVTGTTGAFGNGEVSFDGVKVAVDINFTGGSLSKDIVPEIVLLNLKLPGQSKPQDQSLIDLIEHGSIDQWITMAVSVFAAQLSKAGSPSGPAGEMGAMVYDLLTLLGLAGETPEFDWSGLYHDPSNIVGLLTDWFRSIAGSQPALKSWLNDWACLKQGIASAQSDETDGHVTGTGTRVDPFAIQLSEIADVLGLSFTVATELSSDGTLYVYPGVRVETSIINPVDHSSDAQLKQVGVQGRVSLEFVELVIPALNQSAPDTALKQLLFPSFDVTVVLLNGIDQTQPLLDIEDPSPQSPGTAARFRLGTVEIGLSYLEASVASPVQSGGAGIGDRSFTPSFKLTGVDTALGSWPVIDLTNFASDLQILDDAITTVVHHALTSFLGSGAGESVKSLAAVLGISPPASYQDGAWPVEEMLLSSTEALEALVRNPLGALAGYYTRCLTTLDNEGEPVWKYLLPSFVHLLGGSLAQTIPDHQTGTVEQPWQVELLSFGAGEPGVYLQAWYPGSSSPPVRNELHLAFSFGVPVTIPLGSTPPPPLAQLIASVGLQLELLRLDLPEVDGSGSFGADWLPGVKAELQVTGATSEGAATPLLTPSLAGVSVQLDEARVATGWSKRQQFYWEADLLNAQLNYAQSSSIKIPALAFTSGALSQEIEDLERLAQLAVNAVGLWLLGHGGRFGVTLTAMLGLLPTLPEVINGASPPDASFEIPPGLTLPGDWPILDIGSTSFFTNPWPLLRTQLARLFSQGAFAEPFMQLLGWAITGQVPPVPAITSAGTFDDPWSVLLTNAWGIEVLVWAESDDQGKGESAGDGVPGSIGFGVRKVMTSATQPLATSSQPGIHVETSIRLDVVRLAISESNASPPVVAVPALPRLSLVCDFASAQSGSPLVHNTATGLTIGSGQLGAYADLSGLNGFALSPVLTLFGAQLTGSDALATVGLVPGVPPVFTSQQGMSVMETLLNALMERLTAAVAPEMEPFPELETIFHLLNDLGLAETEVWDISPPVSPPMVNYLGIDIGAWESLLANPGAFLKSQMTGVLLDPALRLAFFAHGAKLLGFHDFKLPPALNGLPELLAAFGLLQQSQAGEYVASLSGWLNLLEHPVQFLEKEGSALFQSQDARKQFISALSNLPAPPIPSPPSLYGLELKVTSGTKLSLEISDPLRVGTELSLMGEMVLDLQALSLSVQVALGSEIFGQALAFRYALALESSGQTVSDWGIALESQPDALPPPFDPLVLYPLKSVDAYLDQLGEEIPLFILSSFTSSMLNRYVLPKHALVANLFSAFGLTAQQFDGTTQITSLLGIFLHPSDWVLSEQVLGDGNGNLSLARVGTLLNALPGAGVVGPHGISVSPVANGMMVSGLPYGVDFTFTADQAGGATIMVGINPVLPPPVPSLNVSAGLSFGAGAGMAASGSVALTIDLSETGGFNPASPPASDTTVTLESSFERGRFALDVTARDGGTAYPFRLVPFEGLNQFIPSEQGIEKLLGFVAGKIGDAYTEYQGKLHEKLIEFIGELQTFAGAFEVTTINELLSLVEQVAAAPHQWLASQFDEAGVSAKVSAIYSLLNDTLKIPGFTLAHPGDDQDLIQFTHGLGHSSPPDQNQVTVSFGVKQVGGQSVFGMWVEPQVQKEWLILDVAAGMALPLSESIELDFTMDAAFRVDTERFDLPWKDRGPELNLSLDVDTKGDFQFSLDFYPLAPASNGGAQGTPADLLLLELLPSVAFAIQDSGTSVIGATDWLSKFAVQFLVPLVADITLDTSAVSGFLNMSIASSAQTPGEVLSAWGLLVQNDAADYELADLPGVFAGKSTTWIVEQLLFSALSVLGGVELIKFQSGGAIYIAATPGPSPSTYTDYGFRVQVTDFQITSSGAQGSTSAASPPAPAGGSGGAAGSSAGTEVLLQLGKWPTGDDSSDNWIERSGGPPVKDEDLGLSVYLLRVDHSDDPSLNARLELVSVGMDILRYGNQPLVNVNGFRLGGTEPRIYLSLDVEEIGATTFGASVRCDDIGIPLGPKLGSGTNNSNPVAQNLMQTGSSSTSTSGGGPQSANGASGTDAVNPVFSLTASYVSAFDLQLHGGQPGDPTGIIWFPVQRAFGPVSCTKIGIGWEEDRKDLFVAFDGAVSLAGLSVNLDDLSIGIPVTTPLDYDNYVFDLQGLNVSFSGGPVEIGGGLLKSTHYSPYYVEYTGDIIIKATRFSITGMGSYAVVSGHPSLFVFFMLNATLGGPAFFFVTGVCGGFGYNRQLILPTQDTVQSFPLVAGISDPSVFGGQDPLEVLNEDVPPAIGTYWLAAGVQFTSFELLQSIVLLVVEFGREFEIALLGLSTLTLPKPSGDGSNAIAYAELQLEATFKPSTGLLAVTLTLTSNSYVLDKDCRLTGGFAFYVWFSGEYRGQFVVTLGGYNPYFTPPDYYPVEPRLGFNWPVSGDINIAGQAYFALTPSCVMAGGGLEATYQSGNLKAWFNAQADFLVAWKPFHYDIYISIDIGASYTIHFIVSVTFSVDLGASLHIWGPRMQGTVHVDWYVISFTIPFGSGDSDPNQPQIIAHYSDFYDYFLSSQQGQSNQSSDARMMKSMAFADNPSDTQQQTVCTASAANGLLNQYQDEELGTVWVVRADKLAIATATSIPATSAVFIGSGANQTETGPTVGLRPMGFTSINSPHTVGIQIIGSPVQQVDLPNDWTSATDTSGVPAALWDTVPNNGNPAPNAKVIPGALVGVKSLSPNQKEATGPPPIDLAEAFSFTPLPVRHLPLAGNAPVFIYLMDALMSPFADALAEIEATVMSADVMQFRNLVLADVLRRGTMVQVGGRLDVMAATAQTTFTAPPLLGSMAFSGETKQAAPGRVMEVSRMKARLGGVGSPAQAARGPVLRALLHRYAHPHRSAGRAARSKVEAHVTGRAHRTGAFAPLHDRKVIAGRVASERNADGSSQHAMRLHAGSTLLWEIEGANHSGLKIEHDGTLPVRIVALNEYHNLIADTIVGAEGKGVHELPEGTVYLSLTTLNRTEVEPHIQQHVGWHSDSLLVQMTPKALLGDGVVIHPQAPVRIPQGRRSVESGFVRGRELFERNIVEVHHTERKHGWIDTLLPAGVRVFAVWLSLADDEASMPEDIAGSIRVAAPLLVTEGASLRREYTTLAAEHVSGDGREACVLYAIPNPELQAGLPYLRVRVETGAGLVQDGLVGFTSGEITDAVSQSSQIRIRPRGVSTAGTQGAASTIRLNCEGGGFDRNRSGKERAR